MDPKEMGIQELQEPHQQENCQIRPLQPCNQISHKEEHAEEAALMNELASLMSDKLNEV
jgi:hypothetical protein